MIFRKEERIAVEDKYGDNITYDAIKGACLRVMSDASEFRLHPSELFYLTFFAIDCLKGFEYRKQVDYCNNDFWYELEDYLSYEKEIGNAADVERAICLNMQAVAELLVRSRDSHYTAMAGALKLQIESHRSDLSDELDTEFSKSFHSVDADELAMFMAGYMEGGDAYSKVIDEMLDSLGGGAESQSHISVECSHIRIAERKKTSVLVVLNAMFKAGWFVDEKGEELKNRDNALNEILRYAFNDSCKGIAQLLTPSENTKTNKNELLMRRLLDEKEMEQYIHDLKEELLKHIK